MPVQQPLTAGGLLKLLRSGFEKIEEHRVAELVKVSLSDTLMSAFAMFSLKDPSLLAFEQRRETDGNLKRVYDLEQVPCDTQMRTTLDEVEPSAVKPLFKDVFGELQQDKVLDKYVFLEGCYLLSLDGTGYFSSRRHRYKPQILDPPSRHGPSPIAMTRSAALSRRTMGMAQRWNTGTIQSAIWWGCSRAVDMRSICRWCCAADPDPR
jgi:hypothetical protein